MADRPGALEVAQQWLAAHSKSKHTHRKYEAQLQQFCEWASLAQTDLTTATSELVEGYLQDVARGKATLSVRNPGAPRSDGTVAVVRSVLRTLFDELVQAGLRPDNPVRNVRGTKAVAPSAASLSAEGVRWLEVRRAIIERAEARGLPRDPLWRAITVAELGSWCGLRRSELAAGRMCDLISLHQGWWIRVPRFGTGNPDLIEVPPPAMKAICAYRVSRGLVVFPAGSEEAVPLISRQTSEQPVNPWTVANALSELHLAEVLPEGSRPPSIVMLRRNVATEAIRAKIASHQLARHLRSSRLVDQVSALEAVDSIAPLLGRLAA